MTRPARPPRRQVHPSSIQTDPSCAVGSWSPQTHCMPSSVVSEPSTYSQTSVWLYTTLCKTSGALTWAGFPAFVGCVVQQCIDNDPGSETCLVRRFRSLCRLGSRSTLPSDTTTPRICLYSWLLVYACLVGRSHPYRSDCSLKTS